MSLLHNHPPNMATTSCPACTGTVTEKYRDQIERGRNGFATSDVWSFNDYLAGVLASGLQVLRDNLHGCPPELCSDDDETWAEEGVKRWQAILDEMIVGFSQEDQQDPTPELQRSLDLLAKWWGHLWD